MALESATYIDDLVPTNPPSGDPLGEADDHLRMLKSVLQTMFDQDGGGPIRKVEWARHAVPIGMIMIWYGTEATIPAGWVACDGGTHTRSDGGGNITAPDLRDRVVAHRGSLIGRGVASGSDSGAHNSSSNGSHNHTATTTTNGLHYHGTNTAGKALTVAELPSHNHGGGSHTHSLASGGAVLSNLGTQWQYIETGSGYKAWIHWTTLAWSGNIVAYEGGGQAHSHGISGDGNHAHNITTTTNGGHTHSTTISRRQLTYGGLFVMKI